MNTATPIHQPQTDVATSPEVVVAFAEMVPPQLEHWLQKRGMRLERSDGRPANLESLATSNARYVILDIDREPRDESAAKTVSELHTRMPAARIIVLSSRSDEMFVRSMTDAGASSVVIKQPYVADLVAALDAASEGRNFVSGQDRTGSRISFSPREQEVLDLVAAGFTNQAIGERLSISVKTVEAHRARIFKKLGASNVADAVMLAIRAGLVML